jgi:hypothetical protein
MGGVRRGRSADALARGGDGEDFGRARSCRDGVVSVRWQTPSCRTVVATHDEASVVGVEFVPVDSCAMVDERLRHRSATFNWDDLVTGSMEEPYRSVRNLIGQDQRKRSTRGRTSVVVAGGDPHVPDWMPLAIEHETEAGRSSEGPTGQHHTFGVAAKLGGPLPDEVQRGTEYFVSAIVGAGRQSGTTTTSPREAAARASGSRTCRSSGPRPCHNRTTGSPRVSTCRR